MKNENLLLLAVAGYLLLKGKKTVSLGTPAATDTVYLPGGYENELPQYGFDYVLASNRIESEFNPIPVQTDSGLIIGGLGGSSTATSTNTTAPLVLDPITGKVIAADPYGAIQTGGGIVSDPQGNVRFSSGGYVRTDSKGNIIPASNVSVEEMRVLQGLPEGKRSFNEITEPYLTVEVSQENKSAVGQSVSVAPKQAAAAAPNPLLNAAISAGAIAITPSPFKFLVPSINLMRGVFKW